MGKRDQHRGSGGGPRPTGVQPADATPRHSIHRESAKGRGSMPIEKQRGSGLQPEEERRFGLSSAAGASVGLEVSNACRPRRTHVALARHGNMRAWRRECAARRSQAMHAWSRAHEVRSARMS